jgi:ankyrin repeat protein
MTRQLMSVLGAASAGNTETLRQLVQVNKDADSHSNDWKTLLYCASAAGRQDAVEVLIGAGAKVNAWVRKRSSPLHTAALFGHRTVLNELINSGAGLESNYSPFDSIGTGGAVRTNGMCSGSHPVWSKRGGQWWRYVWQDSSSLGCEDWAYGNCHSIIESWR